MIINTPVPELELSEGLTTKNFGIDTEDMPHVLDILRNRMYSNKILAVLREYAANCFDAHIEAGIPERPIEITLPNSFDSCLRFRDFGFGLSQHDIENLYIKYGKSKRRGNNNTIGALGFGCKSGFCLGDQFTVTSWHCGVKSVYSCFIDPTRMGQVACLGHGADAGPSGIEVAVPIDSNDWDDVYSEARELFRFWNPAPIFKGIAEFSVNKEEIIYQGDGWQFRGEGDSVAVMGNIPYRIDKHSLDGDLHNILSSGLHLFFNLGEISIAPSREALEYDTKTKDAIKAKVAPIHATLRQMINTEIEKRQTRWEAVLFYKDLNHYESSFFKIRNLIGDFIWKGKTISETYIDLNEFAYGDNGLQKFKCEVYGMVYRRGKYKLTSEETNYIHPNAGVQVFLNDLPPNTRAIPYLVDVVKENCPKVYVLKGDADSFIQNELAGIEVKKLSTMPKKIQVRAKKTDAPRLNKDICKLYRGWSRRSDCWLPEIPAEGSYYVVTDRSNAGFGGNNVHPRHAYELLRDMVSLGFPDVPIYGVKKQALKTRAFLRLKMVKLDEVIKKWLDEEVVRQNVAQRLADFEAVDKLGNLCMHLKKYNLVLDLPVLSPIQYFCQCCEGSKDKSIESWKKLIGFFGLRLPETETTVALCQKEVLKTYPLLKVLDEIYDDDDESLPTRAHILEYIQAINYFHDAKKIREETP